MILTELSLYMLVQTAYVNNQCIYIFLFFTCAFGKILCDKIDI